MRTAFNPNAAGAGFAPADLAVLGAWGTVSAILARD
jgi:hypothetical protein